MIKIVETKNHHGNLLRTNVYFLGFLLWTKIYETQEPPVNNVKITKSSTLIDETDNEVVNTPKTGFRSLTKERFYELVNAGKNASYQNDYSYSDNKPLYEMNLETCLEDN